MQHEIDIAAVFFLVINEWLIIFSIFFILQMIIFYVADIFLLCCECYYLMLVGRTEGPMRPGASQFARLRLCSSLAPVTSIIIIQVWELIQLKRINEKLSVLFAGFIFQFSIFAASALLLSTNLQWEKFGRRIILNHLQAYKTSVQSNIYGFTISNWTSTKIVVC